MPKNVDEYLAEGCGRCALGGTPQCKVHNWPDALVELRRIVLECGLDEEIKWGVPCYTFQQKNIVIISAFKEYCSLSFFKGSLLADIHQLLEKPGENTQTARLIKFTEAKDVLSLEAILKAYIFEAVEVEKSGIKGEKGDGPREELVLELVEILEQNNALKEAWEALTPGRQRGYNLYFAQAKQSKTRISRIEKYIEKIMSGKGFHD